jgi:uncharacterized protein (TIGR02145 family)
MVNAFQANAMKQLAQTSLFTLCAVLLSPYDSDGQSCGLVSDELRTVAATYGCGTPVVHQGVTYATVAIGDQCWFAENVRYLPSVSSDEDWGNGAQAYVYGYKGTDVNEAMALPEYLEYGVLYNHAAAVNWDVCPTGWHLSTHTEFYALRTYLESNQGGKLKTTGTAGGGDGLWNDPNTGATNETGFSAKPGGVAQTGAFSIRMGNEAHFWTPANAPGMSKQSFYVRYNTGSLDMKTDHQACGKSIRCVRD